MSDGSGDFRSSHPPVGFPLYGLAAQDLPRWLDFVDGPLGKQALGVWLRHGTRPELRPQDVWARVGSLPRERHARAMTLPDQDPVREVAWAAIFALINHTYPGPAGRPDGYGHRILGFADREADRYEDWDVAHWTVGSKPVNARVLEWAGAWAGFTTALPEVDVVVVAAGINPMTLALAQVVDTSSYHFDVTAPIRLAEVAERGMTEALGDPPPRDRDGYWPLHADQVRAVV